jgi:hypothetical protein
MTIHIEHRLDLFLPEEVQQIIDLGDALILEEGKIKDDRVDHSIRNSKIAWIHPEKDTWWLFDRAIMVFKSSLPFSSLQSMQYTVYDSKGSHYDWHRDIGSGDEIMKARINVAVLQLSDPGNYKGGVLQIKYPSVKGGAFRGRYNKDGSTSQKLETRPDDKANAITTVSKDSILVEQDEVIDVMKTRGMVTTFPIQLEHRVTPVTSGVRKTLIMWGLK